MEAELNLKMQKHVVLICDGGAQFGVVVDEQSVKKVLRQILADLEKSSPRFICFAHYVPVENPCHELWVKKSIVNAVRVADISNIQVPGKQILLPNIPNRG